MLYVPQKEHYDHFSLAITPFTKQEIYNDNILISLFLNKKASFKGICMLNGVDIRVFFNTESLNTIRPQDPNGEYYDMTKIVHFTQNECPRIFTGVLGTICESPFR